MVFKQYVKPKCFAAWYSQCHLETKEKCLFRVECLQAHEELLTEESSRLRSELKGFLDFEV
jgi:hypothetical protein